MHPNDRDTPDYIHYSLTQLRNARRTIDSERFPERTHLLDMLIADREHREICDAQRAAATPPENSPALSERLHALLQRFRFRGLTLKLTPALRRTLATLSIGGGFIGIVSAFANMFSASALSFVFVTPAVLIFALGIISGIMLFEHHPQAALRNQAYWALQIPVLFSPLLSYQISGGLQLNIGINVSFIDAWFTFFAGSSFTLNVLQNQPTLLGINLVAVALTWLLMHAEDVDAPASGTEPEQPAAPATETP